jgi:soluble lytic murein transglycosylase
VRVATGELALFAAGVTQFEAKNYAAAEASLERARKQVPTLVDYVDYYLAAAQDARNDHADAVRTLGALEEFLRVKSPLLAKAAILDAKARLATGNATPGVLKPVVDALRAQSMTSAQPEGDFALAVAYETGNDGAQAATYYQRVYFLYPATEMAAYASAALDRLKQSLGTAYPAALPEMMLERGDGWIQAKDYAKARGEFEGILPQLHGVEQEQARVRMGAAQLAGGDYRGAYQYLKSLDLPRDEADAERLYYIGECARRMDNDTEMMDAVKDLARHHERSVWRLKALVAAGNRYLVTHQPDQYEPLYRAAWVTFPSDSTTSYCHWKITWDAYLASRKDAGDLLKEQIEHYPGDNKSATALYYLGRISERENDYPAARSYYERVMREFPNFYYAVLARGRIADSHLVSATASEKTAAWLDTIEFPAHADYTGQTPSQATQARIARARLLVAAGMADFADAEVRFSARTDGQPHLLAVGLARTDAAPFLSLRHMKALAPDYLSTSLDKAPKEFWQMLFPLPYTNALVSSARQQNLDPYMVAALIRQESEFNPGAHSHANAYGLTQIVPATGRMLARRQGIRVFSTSLLYQPETNLRLGASYLRALLDQWNGHWEETLASYNAGASRVKEWQSWSNYREPAEFVESIPFTETREYVQAVIRNASVYRQIYGSGPLVEQPTPQARVVAKSAVKRRNPS